jgi:hypothetical protein
MKPNRQIEFFSPQNWVKAKTCLVAINAAISMYFNMLPNMPGGKEQSRLLRGTLKLDRDCFDYRWAAD